MICQECRDNDHGRCVVHECDCDTCWQATVEPPCWHWFWVSVGQWIDAAYRQPPEDLDDLRAEVEWLRRVERGEYGD